MVAGLLLPLLSSMLANVTQVFISLETFLFRAAMLPDMCILARGLKICTFNFPIKLTGRLIILVPAFLIYIKAFGALRSSDNIFHIRLGVVQCGCRSIGMN